MTLVWTFLGAFGLLVAFLVWRAAKAGPRQLSPVDLGRARSVLSATREAPGEGWQALGSRTEARGLDLCFDHDDDPQAEATLLAPEDIRTKKRSTFGHARTVRLGEEVEEHHVHTSGWVFRARLRGTGAVVGRDVRLLMIVGSDGRPLGGRIENDDDTDAAVGDWIEVEAAELLQVRGKAA
jgi:hypothetical protein